MDTMVTARVPVEICDQGNAILRQLGVTPTALVNRAYEYLIAERALPAPAAKKRRARKLGASEQAELQGFFAAATVLVSPEFCAQSDPRAYKELLTANRKAEYEALA